MYLHLGFRVCVSHPVHGTVVLQQPVVISPVWDAKKYSNSDKPNPNQNSTTRSSMSTINVFNSDK